MCLYKKCIESECKPLGRFHVSEIVQYRKGITPGDGLYDAVLLTAFSNGVPGSGGHQLPRFGFRRPVERVAICRWEGSG